MFFLGRKQLLCCPDFAAAARGHLEELQEVLAIEETSVFRCGVFAWVQRKLVDLHMAKCFVPERLNMVLGHQRCTNLGKSGIEGHLVSLELGIHHR